MSMKRVVIQSLPIPALPGWESQIILLEFPPGASAPPHTHPVSGMSFVVKGKMISHYEGQEVKEYSAGESFIDPCDTLHHRAENASSDEWLIVTVTYVVKTGHPTSVPA